MTQNLTKKQLLDRLKEICLNTFGCTLEDATEKQMYRVVCLYTRVLMEEKRRAFRNEVREKEGKQVYYMSMEFLVGTSLRNNLYNLGLLRLTDEVLQEQGFSLERLCGMDPDAGLGNGGLGRLASCYMDAASGLRYPVTGFSIRYEFGIFKQKIIDGWQMEFPDDWLEMGDVWLHTRKDEAVEVRFGGHVHEWVDENGKFRAAQSDYQAVTAVPHDMFISGYHSDAVNTLVLWSASVPDSLDMAAFSRGDYVRALERNTMAETISKVLYPADDHIEGKRLRLRQQYLLVSASLQSILNQHFKQYHTYRNLPDKVAIHINDTHPALCVPELMRLLVDEHDYSWEEAWDITCRTLSYTNHTVMQEALERWSIDLFREQLPRIFGIVQEINRRLMLHLAQVYPNDPGKWEYMAVVSNGEVRMANLCLACCHMVNGVSKLHTEILETTIFRDYYNLNPQGFTNVTNGIAYRRRHCQANPELTANLQELIAHGILDDANALEALLKYQGDPAVLAGLRRIKHTKKEQLADYVARTSGVLLDPDSLFDVQVKRLHEYKRQLMNALSIMDIYFGLKDGTLKDFTPTVCIFGAKAAPGYRRAKAIIRYINRIAELINNDPDVSGKLKVVFVQNYNCSYAEHIIPAADISEQISPAGTEASGTGNMKLMLNGAVTLGTMDGANVEIVEQAGMENNYIFGAKVEELNAIRETYRSRDIYEKNPRICRVVDTLIDGTVETDADQEELYTALLDGASWHRPDHYFVMYDFESYQNARLQANADYRDRLAFGRKCLMNTASAGKFSSDRTIRQYADEIWHIKPER